VIRSDRFLISAVSIASVISVSSLIILLSARILFSWIDLGRGSIWNDGELSRGVAFGGGIRQGVILGYVRGSDYGGAIGEGVPRLLILLVL